MPLFVDDHVFREGVDGERSERNQRLRGVRCALQTAQRPQTVQKTPQFAPQATEGRFFRVGNAF